MLERLVKDIERKTTSVVNGRVFLLIKTATNATRETFEKEDLILAVICIVLYLN